MLAEIKMKTVGKNVYRRNNIKRNSLFISLKIQWDVFLIKKLHCRPPIDPIHWHVLIFKEREGIVLQTNPTYIRNLKRIAKRNLRSWFWFDVYYFQNNHD
jgi:hypothetical protein